MTQSTRPEVFQALQEDREKIHRQMLSSVSHDLKTPLASMIGSLEIYQRMKSTLPENKKDMLITTALEEARRLDNFISNILDMAKLETGQVRLNKEVSDVRMLVKQCCKRHSERLSNVDLQLVEPADKVEVPLDVSLISRVVNLLLDNAIKYSPMSGKKIWINYATSDNGFSLDIRDNGPGIPESRQEEIFNKYTRLTKQDSQAAGTGLGLAICRVIAQMHGGTVNVRNHSDGGAVFTLALPVK